MRISFLLVLALLFFYSALAFTKPNLIYFDDYAKNREAFLSLTNQVSSEKWTLQREVWHPAMDSHLTTDVALFKNKRPQKTLLVFSSGIHGIEGYVGSAIQRWIIQNKLMDNNAAQADLAFIHILNPWGMQNQRRVDENNFDLNRNFLTHPADFELKNDAYIKIDHFLNPKQSLNLGLFHRVQFIAQAINLILYNSLETLRKSILLGQSDQPRGLFFRGRHFSTLKASVDAFLVGVRKNYEKII